jgi:prepilin peptidase CpaA
MDTFAFPTGLFVFALVIAAAGFDLHARRIPNKLILLALIVAVPVQWIVHGGFAGLWLGLQGLTAGIAVMLPFYLLRAFGAGDAKLMGAIGAFVGPSTVLMVAVATFLVGGIWALFLVVQRRQLRHAGNSLVLICTHFAYHKTQATQAAPETSLGRLPYGVAIALGTAATMLLLH